MKIDFHTHYSRWHLKGLCKKAKKLGLDALVMTGLKENKDFEYKGIKIFPAQEVDWKAVLEIPHYKYYENFEDNLLDFTEHKTFYGKSLVILPSDTPFLTNPDERLYNLMSNVNKFGGITISLQNDENYSIVTNREETGPFYPFDAVRIRPENSVDNYITSLRGTYIGGSNAHCAKELSAGKAYTEIPYNFNTNKDLISTIKNKISTKLFVHGHKKNQKINIQDTVKPMEIDTRGIGKKIFG